MSECVVLAPVGDRAVVQGETEVGRSSGSVILGVLDDLEGPGLLGGGVVEVNPVALFEQLHPLRLPPLGLVKHDLVHPANWEEGLVIQEAHTPALVSIESLSGHGKP